MSVMLRLSRQGAKKVPKFLIVAMDKAKRRDGKFLASLGSYYPLEKDPQKRLKLDTEAIKGWIANGARCSETVGQLLKKLPK